MSNDLAQIKRLDEAWTSSFKFYFTAGCPPLNYSEKKILLDAYRGIEENYCLFTKAIQWFFKNYNARFSGISCDPRGFVLVMPQVIALLSSEEQPPQTPEHLKNPPMAPLSVPPPLAEMRRLKAKWIEDLKMDSSTHRKELLSCRATVAREEEPDSRPDAIYISHVSSPNRSDEDIYMTPNVTPAVRVGETVAKVVAAMRKKYE